MCDITDEQLQVVLNEVKYFDLWRQTCYLITWTHSPWHCYRCPFNFYIRLVLCATPLAALECCPEATVEIQCCSLSCKDQITPALYHFHWLPITSRPNSRCWNWSLKPYAVWGMHTWRTAYSNIKLPNHSGHLQERYFRCPCHLWLQGWQPEKLPSWPWCPDFKLFSQGDCVKAPFI